MGKPKNGLHFFSENWSRGPSWYVDQLAAFRGCDVLVEFSVSYLYPEHARDAARRIRSLTPEAELFVVVRDPVSRALSDYLRSLRVLEIDVNLSFEQSLYRHPEFFDRGRYAQLLAPYIECFPKCRICVLFYDDLVANPRAFVAPLLGRLGLDAGADALASAPAWRRVTGAVRSATVQQLVLGAKVAADRTAGLMGLDARWSRFKARHVDRYRRVLALNQRRVALDPSLARDLRREFESDVAFLEVFTGRDLSAWREGA